MAKPTTLDRRGFLGACVAAGGFAGAAPAAALTRAELAGSLPTADVPPKSQTPGIYGRLGVRPVINAAGILTRLGGSLLLPEVKQAMDEAAGSYVRLDELIEASGRRIAELAGVEAALVTCGAAAALTVGTAACVTGEDTDRIQRVPDTSGMPDEVLIQRAHRHGFEHSIRAVGVRMVEVETAEDLESAISDRTAMMHFLAFAEEDGGIDARTWVDVARKYGVPTFVDAAAELPPAENLHRFTDLGFDLVCFSGGKGLRGPQCSGLLLGRADLIGAATLNSSPNSNSIGRAAKVGKEEIAGLVRAVELYVERDHAADKRGWQSTVERWDEALAGLPELKTRHVGPRNAGKVPYLSLDWDEGATGFTHQDLVDALREGDPPVEVWPTQDRGVCVTPFMLDPGEEEVVSERVGGAYSELASRR